MKVYELENTLQVLKTKYEALQKSLDAAEERARTYYNERLLPAELDDNVDDDEMEAIYQMNDSLCDTCTAFENKAEIAYCAIRTLEEAIEQLKIAICEGVLEEEQSSSFFA